MKRTGITVFICVVAILAVGFRNLPFENWNSVIENSPEIIIASCNKTPARLEVGPDGKSIDIAGHIIDANIGVVSVLKGNIFKTNLVLRSSYWPRQGEAYLIFGHLSGAIFNAPEKYRIVPLGMHYDPAMISGKPLDRQIKLLFNYRLSGLKRQMEDEQREKIRLEDGLK